MKAKNGDLHREPFLDVFKILNSLDQCKFIFDGRKIKAFISNPQMLFNYFLPRAYSMVKVHKTGQWSEGNR